MSEDRAARLVGDLGAVLGCLVSALTAKLVKELPEPDAASAVEPVRRCQSSCKEKPIFVELLRREIPLKIAREMEREALFRSGNVVRDAVEITILPESRV
jgi:hypothetical protein